MKNRGFGHLKTRLFTTKTSKHVGFGGSWFMYFLLGGLIEKKGDSISRNFWPVGSGGFGSHVTCHTCVARL